MLVNRDRGLVTMLDCPDDVLWSERRIAAEEHAGARRLESHLVYHRHIPLVELDAEVAFHPGERILLADRQDHIVAGEEFFTENALRLDAAAIDVVLHLLERHADELAVLDHERLGRMIDDDLDVLFLGILQLPLRRLEEAARLARHDFHALRAEPERRATAVHRRVADADDKHALADRFDVAEGHRFEPGDTDVDAIGVVTARQHQLLAFRRTRSDEHRIELSRGEKCPHAVDAVAEPEINAHANNLVDLIVEHFGWQAEGRNIGAHQAARLVESLEDGDFIAERQQIVRHRERGATGADTGDVLAVLHFWNLRQPVADVVAQIRSHTLQPADRDRLF